MYRALIWRHNLKAINPKPYKVWIGSDIFRLTGLISAVICKTMSELEEGYSLTVSIGRVKEDDKD